MPVAKQLQPQSKPRIHERGQEASAQPRNHCAIETNCSRLPAAYACACQEQRKSEAAREVVGSLRRAYGDRPQRRQVSPLGKEMPLTSIVWLSKTKYQSASVDLEERVLVDILVLHEQRKHMHGLQLNYLGHRRDPDRGNGVWLNVLI